MPSTLFYVPDITELCMLKCNIGMLFLGSVLLFIACLLNQHLKLFSAILHKRLSLIVISFAHLILWKVIL